MGFYCGVLFFIFSWIKVQYHGGCFIVTVKLAVSHCYILCVLTHLWSLHILVQQQEKYLCLLS